MFMLNIISISDIHFVNEEYSQKHICNIDLHFVDLFVYCGDILRSRVYEPRRYVKKSNKPNIQRIISFFNYFTQRIGRDKVYIILGNNDNVQLINDLDQCGIVIYGNKELTIKGKHILFSSFSETGSNTFAHDKPLPSDLSKYDIIFTHGTFKKMLEYNNKLFVHGHHHLNTRFALKMNVREEPDDDRDIEQLAKTIKSFPYYFFEYKHNTYINVSITVDNSSVDRKPFYSLICINKKVELYIIINNHFYKMKNVKYNTKRKIEIFNHGLEQLQIRNM